MVSNIETETMTVAEATDLVEGVYRDSYDREIKAKMKRGKKAVTPNGSSDETKVYTTSSGKVRIDFSNASTPVAKKVKQAIEEPHGSQTSPPRRFEEDNGVGVDESSDNMDRSFDRSPEVSEEGSDTGHGKVRSFRPDGYMEFKPPFTKDESGYTEAASGPNDNACQDCSHYVEGGGCLMVQGEIDKNAKCESFYSDIGIFARFKNAGGMITSIHWGEKFDAHATMDKVRSMIESVKERVNNRPN